MATTERRIDQLTALAAPLVLTDEMVVSRSGRAYRASADTIKTTMGAGLPYSTSGTLGLTVDGATDIAAPLNAAIETLSTAGGGHIIFASTDGSSPYINGTVINRSNVKLDFTYVPSVILGPYGSLRNEGGYSEFAAVVYLLANATSGLSTFTVAPVSGSASDVFAAGDKIIIRGNRDSGGGALWYQEATVTAVDGPSGTITITETLSYSYLIDYPSSGWAAAGNTDKTTVSKRVSSLLTADMEIGDKTLAVTSASGFVIGDMIEVRDEKQCDDIAGASTALINTEHFLITEIATNTLTVDRRSKRKFDNAYNACCWLVAPCVNSSIVGANIVFSDIPPASPRVDTIINWHAYRCTIERCRILNATDDALVGSRGQMFANRYSFRCGIYDCIGERPKYTAGGEGICLTHFHSTECDAAGLSASSCRHAVYHEASTDCHSHFVGIRDGLSVAVDFHGCLEKHCHVTADHAESGKVGGNNTDFVAFSHSDNYAGTFNCSASCDDGEYFDIVAVYEPGADGCAISGSFENVRVGAQIYNRAAADPVVVTEPTLIDLHLDTVSEYVVNADGQNDGDGGTDKPIVDLRLVDVYAKNVIKGFRIRNVDGCSIMACELDGHDVDPGDTYLFRIHNVTGLTITDNTFSSIGRAFALTGTNGAFAIMLNRLNRLADPGYTEVLNEAGTNTDFLFYGNDAIGFTPSETHASTPALLNLALLGA